jgi:hypothetical protein
MNFFIGIVDLPFLKLSGVSDQLSAISYRLAGLVAF